MLCRRLSNGPTVAAMFFTALNLIEPAPAHSLCEYFNFRLDPGQVVPRAEMQGSGWSELHLCDDDSLRGYVVINMEETVTAVHIHGPAAPGENGFLLYELPLPTEHGLAVLLGSVPAEQRAWLVAYRAYVDVHTETYPEGAIRGQILDRGLTVTRTPWQAVKELFR